MTAQRSGLSAIALAWLEDDGPHDLEAIASRVTDAIRDLSKVILVGHSMGTPIAMLTALQSEQGAERHPSKIKGLVLSNSGANTRGHGDITALLDRIRDDWDQPFWDAFMARCFHTLPSSPLLEAVRHYPSRLRQQAVIDVLQSQRQIDFVPLLPQLAGKRIAVVHGKHDQARTIDHARELAEGIPGATLHVFDTGHTSCAEDPDRFAEVLGAMAAR